MGTLHGSVIVAMTAPTTHPLRSWRLAHGLTLREVGDLVGLDPSTVNRVEMGSRRLAPMQRVAFARRVGVRVGDLFPVENVEPDDE